MSKSESEAIRSSSSLVADDVKDVLQAKNKPKTWFISLASETVMYIVQPVNGNNVTVYEIYGEITNRTAETAFCGKDPH